MGFGISGTGSGSFGRGANVGSALKEGELLDLCCDGLPEKRCCPIPSHLRDCSR